MRQVQGRLRETPMQLRSVAARYQRFVAARGTPRGLRLLLDDRLEQASCTEAGDNRQQKLLRLEAVLFLAREPLNTRKISQHASLADGTEARTLIQQLNQRYDDTGRSFRAEEVAGGYQLLTRAQFAPWLRRLGTVPAETRLSAPMMETLAVVAYRQPVLRADIEAIRGVSCGEILRQLMERDLVRIGGRSDELGRPYLYATTKRFLQTFGLRTLDQLPRAESLRMPLPPGNEDSPGHNLVDPDTDPTASVDARDLEDSEVTVSTPTATPSGEELEQLKTQSAPQQSVDEDDDYGIDEYEDEEDDFDDEWGDDDDDDDDDDLDEELDDEWEEVEDEGEDADEDWGTDDDEDDDWGTDDDDDEDWD